MSETDGAVAAHPAQADPQVGQQSAPNDGQEAIAPWQQEELGGSQGQGEEEESTLVKVDDGDHQQEVVAAAIENHAQENAVVEEEPQDTAMVMGEEAEFDPLAGLGSAEEIAAAAMQAAGVNFSAVFGDGVEMSNEEEVTSTLQGTKRTHDEMEDDQDQSQAQSSNSNVNVNATVETAQADKKEASPPSASLPQSSVPTGDSTATISAPPSTSLTATTGSSASAPTTSTISAATTAPVVQEVPATSNAEQKPVEMPAFSLESLDLEAVAQAAMGLDANGNPLPGNEESHRALAEAVKQLSAAQGITLPSGLEEDDEEGDYSGKGPVKRFQCTQCERAFARAYNLNTHLATHDPDPARSKPFPCPYPSCKVGAGRSFSRKHDLQRHVASTHENEPEPTVIGENGENQAGGLASLGLGTPGRKFRCDECGRAFVRRDALKRHQCTRSAETAPNPLPEKAQPDYYSNAAAGLSLYTSNATPATRPSGSSTQTSQAAAASKSSESAAASSYDSDPFGPNGITYENLSKEVQDMAMQLVAQAQSYNEQQASASQTTEKAAPPPAPRPLPQQPRPPQVQSQIQKQQPRPSQPQQLPQRPPQLIAQTQPQQRPPQPQLQQQQRPAQPQTQTQTQIRPRPRPPPQLQQRPPQPASVQPPQTGPSTMIKTEAVKAPVGAGALQNPATVRPAPPVTPARPAPVVKTEDGEKKLAAPPPPTQPSASSATGTMSNNNQNKDNTSTSSATPTPASLVRAQ